MVDRVLAAILGSRPVAAPGSPGHREIASTTSAAHTERSRRGDLRWRTNPPVGEPPTLTPIQRFDLGLREKSEATTHADGGHPVSNVKLPKGVLQVFMYSTRTDSKRAADRSRC
jgi:hypothetical protein